MTEAKPKTDARVAGVPTDPDTRVLHRSPTSIDDIPTRLEHWSWDGIYGRSLIFAEADVANLDDAELEAIARQSPLFDGELAVSRNRDGYAFVNSYVCCDD